MSSETHLLRTHHALCAQFFEGKGYSEEFVRHMGRVLAEFGRDDPEITLTDGCDVICSRCPNNEGGVCSDGKVRGIDRRAAEAMGVSPGSTYAWSELLRIAADRVIKPGRLREVCGDCEWIGICTRK